MEKRRLAIFCTLFAILSSCAVPAPPLRADRLRSEPLVRELGRDISIEIDPRIELLSGILLNSSWANGPGAPEGPPSAYVQELKNLLGPQTANRAIRNTDALEKKGFAWDAPPHLVLATTGGLRMERPKEGHSAYLRERGHGGLNLDAYLASLRAAASASSFDRFWLEHRNYYDAVLDRASAGLKAGKVADWLLAYYGADGEYRFHYILAPAMFPNGGYSATVDRTENGQRVRHVYQVVRKAEGIEGEGLQALALHEFGHAFVNPAIGDRIPPEASRGLETLFDPVKPRMKALAYTNLGTFLNELVLRACVVRGQVLLGFVDEEGADAELAREELQGFYPIREVYAELADYEADRTAYPDFAAFGPVLLERLSAKAEDLVAGHMAGPKPVMEMACGFEGLEKVPGPAFSLELGASNKGKGGMGRVFLDTRAPYEGAASLGFSGSADTTIWRIVKLPLAIEKGKLSLSWAARGTGLRLEGEQFDNAYVGLIVTDKAGKKNFIVRKYGGTFDWRRDGLEIELDPDAMSRVDFCIFLSISGELSVDDIKIQRN